MEEGNIVAREKGREYAEEERQRINKKWMQKETLKEEEESVDPGETRTQTDLGNMSTFEDLMQLAGTRGRWNLLIFLLCAYSAFPTSLPTLGYQFLGATLDHWCHIEPLVEANWTQEHIFSFAIPYNNVTGNYESCRKYDYDYSVVAQLGYQAAMQEKVPPTTTISQVPCSSRDFNLTQYESTVTTEWDLVCERRVLYATTQAAVQGGKLIGFFISGYFLDKFGRRPVILCSAVFSIICGFLTAVAPTIEIYIVFVALVSFVNSGVYLGCFVLVMEISSTQSRSRLGSLFAVPWSIGYMVIAGVAYLVRSWQWLQVTITLPALLFTLYYWLLPESPRWLILHNQLARALEVLHWAAKVNDKKLPPDHHLLSVMEKIAAKEKQPEIRGGRVLDVLLQELKHIVSLVRVRTLRRRSLIVFFCWLAASVVYYGVALNSTNLSINTYLYIFLGGLLEMPSYILLWPAVVFLGRVKSLSVLYCTTGSTILLISVFILFIPETPWVVVMLVSLIGKTAITAAYQLVWMMTAELFPTKYRSLALGHASFLGKTGTILSPYINDILGSLVVWAPSTIFGLLSLIAGGLCLLLPETRGRQLPESNNIKHPEIGDHELPESNHLEQPQIGNHELLKNDHIQHLETRNHELSGNDHLKHSQPGEVKRKGDLQSKKSLMYTLPEKEPSIKNIRSGIINIAYIAQLDEDGKQVNTKQ
ncbi:organic cation transporter protein [Cherax quadricarinatus]|uniref:organic cation transporter protein n=1 Tax=Cherax quadricarinatus TaxID=27406 RepID=UPI00387E3639